MKTVLKRIAAVLMIIAIVCSVSVMAYAETIEDRLQAWMEEIVEKYNSSTPEGQENIQNGFNEFLEKYGLGDIDLGSLSETDIGKIIGNLGDNLAIEDFFNLAKDAFASGGNMIKDALAGGLGTVFGENTGTTKAPVTSPNVIVTVPNQDQTQPNQNAVGIPEAEGTTYNIENSTAPNIVGPGVTVNEPVSAPVLVDEGVNTSSVVVLIVLCVATVAVLAAIVIFFVLKRR